MSRYLPKKTKTPKWPITILFDDREKRPWKISHSRFKFIRKRLKTGDYTIQGMEKKLCIERKSGWAEFLQNISSKNRADFERKLANLAEYEYAYFIIEDVLDNVPKVLKRTPTRMTIISVYYWLTKICCTYNINLLLVGKDKTIRNQFLFEFFSGVASVK